MILRAVATSGGDERRRRAAVICGVAVIQLSCERRDG
jgi:hypothetical protein